MLAALDPGEGASAEAEGGGPAQGDVINTNVLLALAAALGIDADDAEGRDDLRELMQDGDTSSEEDAEPDSDEEEDDEG